jgi:hypothetical protein
MRPRLLAWAERHIATHRNKSGDIGPDFVIKHGPLPYLERWYVIPRNPIFCIYLHRFRMDDEDRAMHDHPSVSLSWILDVGYFEITPQGKFWRPPGAIITRKATQLHRVVLKRDDGNEPIPAISLFFFGPKYRNWGFDCPRRWVPWQEFTAPGDPGSVGKGCD